MGEPMPLILVVTLLVAAMMAAYEFGLRLHPRLRSRADGSKLDGSDESHALSGVSGLLALLMAFSFSLALDRYEERRMLVTAEANAIGTFSTRLGLLPDEDRAGLRQTLAVYGAARLKVGISQDDGHREFAQAEALRDALGVRLYEVLQRYPFDARTTLLAQEFDAMGDVATERRAARSARLPTAVLVLLVVYCIAGACLLGYTVAASAAKHRTTAGLFFILLGFAFAIVLDLDRPRGGFILVPQDEMIAAVALLSR